jgi:hypothetical protein
MSRITKKVKAIADAHIEAKIKGDFDNPYVSTKAELIKALEGGKTFRSLLDNIEARHCTITSMLLSATALGVSHSYKKGVYAGFKEVFNEIK